MKRRFGGGGDVRWGELDFLIHHITVVCCGRKPRKSPRPNYKTQHTHAYFCHRPIMACLGLATEFKVYERAVVIRIAQSLGSR